MDTRLARFKVNGYRSFSNPIVLDFTMVHDYKFNRECVNNGIITKMGIYGPNNSGKSNLGLALFSIVPVLTDKFVSPTYSNESLFLNVDKKFRSAEFVYDFINKRDEYIYSFSKKDENTLVKESLVVNGKKIYEYDYLKKEFLTLKFGEIVNENLNFEYIGDNLSILRYVANNSRQAEDSPIRHIMGFVSNMLWFRSVRSNEFIGLENNPSFLDTWIINNGYIADFSNFLKEACGINTKLNNEKILVEEHENGLIAFSEAASSGTKSLELFYYWMKRFDNVSFLYMDEFDAYYHFSLSGTIIKKLKSFTSFQAVFTTHNISLLSNELLRPDCYFFLENGRLKSYFEIAGNRELREGHNLEKIYRNGIS